jgi:hypothetical protein
MEPILNYIWLSLIVWTSYALCERLISAPRTWVGYSQIAVVVVILGFISLLCPIGRKYED